MLERTKPQDGREPIPEMLSRHDIDVVGEWDIKPCAAQRGAPMTILMHREMHVPVEDNELARVIRAHEMMHAKVSPQDKGPWFARGRASQQGLMVAEELRVNYLIERQGFNTKALLDGSEMASGELYGKQGDWSNAVYTLAATVHTGGLNKFLTGMRRENPDWAKALRAVATELKKMIKRADKGRYGRGYGRIRSTNDYEGIGPRGYLVTEEIAEWLDRIADPPKGDDQTDQDNEQGEQVIQAEGGKKPAPIKVEAIQKQKPVQDAGVSWDDLKIGKLPLTRHAPGGLGAKRLPAQRGRNPRRLQRALLDPHRRVFDQKIRGKGGIVVIDGSGSMHLEMSEVLAMVEAAPGCTVVMYRTNRHDEKMANLWILADKGKMVSELPKTGGSNGVDFPALQWAVARRRNNEPIVWITDGAVHPTAVGYRDSYGMDCIKMVLKHKIIVLADPEKAIEGLRAMRNGRKIKSYTPRYWAATWRKVTGKGLRI